MMNQNSTTQAVRKTSKKTANSNVSLNRFLIATGLILCAAGAVVGTSMASNASTVDYRSLGFESAAQMKSYLTITSSEIREIPTSRAMMRKVADVTINVGPVQIGNPNSAGTPPSQVAQPRPPVATPVAPAPTTTTTTTATPAPSKPPVTIQAPGIGAGGASIGGIDPSQILPWISLGEKIWELIAANKPVVSVQTKRAFVLPVAEQDWTQMENWKGPAVHTYQLQYKNGFGSTVITHVYTIAYNYGGTYNEQGQFLANVTVIPSKVDVAWGYTLNTSVELGEAVNTASKSSPVPGIEVQIITKVDTVLKHAETRDGFFVKGSGECQPLTNPAATLVPN